MQRRIIGPRPQTQPFDLVDADAVDDVASDIAGGLLDAAQIALGNPAGTARTMLGDGLRFGASYRESRKQSRNASAPALAAGNRSIFDARQSELFKLRAARSAAIFMDWHSLTPSLPGS